jgi:hypothetical protein
MYQSLEAHPVALPLQLHQHHRSRLLSRFSKFCLGLICFSKLYAFEEEKTACVIKHNAAGYTPSLPPLPSNTKKGQEVRELAGFSILAQ